MTPPKQERLSYVYRINFVDDYYYIGSRLCPWGVLPEEDTKYVGSPRSDQAEKWNTTKFSKEILKVFQDRRAALQYEMGLVKEHLYLPLNLNRSYVKANGEVIPQKKLSAIWDSELEIYELWCSIGKPGGRLLSGQVEDLSPAIAYQMITKWGGAENPNIGTGNLRKRHKDIWEKETELKALWIANDYPGSVHLKRIAEEAGYVWGEGAEQSSIPSAMILKWGKHLVKRRKTSNGDKMRGKRLHPLWEREEELKAKWIELGHPTPNIFNRLIEDMTIMVAKSMVKKWLPEVGLEKGSTSLRSKSGSSTKTHPAWKREKELKQWWLDNGQPVASKLKESFPDLIKHSLSYKLVNKWKEEVSQGILNVVEVETPEKTPAGFEKTGRHYHASRQREPEMKAWWLSNGRPSAPSLMKEFPEENLNRAICFTMVKEWKLQEGIQDNPEGRAVVRRYEPELKALWASLGRPTVKSLIESWNKANPDRLIESPVTLTRMVRKWKSEEN